MIHLSIVYRRLIQLPRTFNHCSSINAPTRQDVGKSSAARTKGLATSKEAKGGLANPVLERPVPPIAPCPIPKLPIRAGPFPATDRQIWIQCLRADQPFSENHIRSYVKRCVQHSGRLLSEELKYPLSAAHSTDRQDVWRCIMGSTQKWRAS